MHTSGRLSLPLPEQPHPCKYEQTCQDSGAVQQHI